MTTPSYACTRSRSPSTTFTCTTTVSPGLKSGTSRVMRLFSISWTILLMALTFDYGPAGCTRGEELIQHAARLGSEPVPDDEVRPAHPRPRRRLRKAPAPNRGVVPRQQHLRHLPPLEHFRPRVVRPVEQAFGERLLDARARIAERARQKAHDGVDHRERRHFSAAQHEIADRQLPIDAELDHALVDSLVPPRDEQKARQGCELLRAALIEKLALRRETDPRAPGRQPRMRGADSSEQRLGLQHHTRSASVRPIIDRAMRIGRMRPHVLRAHSREPALERSSDDAVRQRGAHHLRKERYDLDVHDILRREAQRAPDALR